MKTSRWRLNDENLGHMNVDGVLLVSGRLEGLILASGRAGKPPVSKIHNFFLRETFLVIPSLSDEWLSWTSVKIGFMRKFPLVVEMHSLE
ncbi:hypothetical protein F2Q68_00035415 [Brassica cretica]|uniref:Uncharacterized protein n=1 Tax=Brassica cretica TaxID=69181 RepID=A0A8S9H3T5_BRACR|nr:hypothetical protein F2Q68_00035415 [Brassica cretica]